MSLDAVRELIADGNVMTSAEVAEALGISRVTVRTMVAKKRLVPIRANTNPLTFSAEQVWALRKSRLSSEESNRVALARSRFFGLT